jgi:hypothetical protein
MRSLRLVVFLAAFALVGASFTAAAVQAGVAGKAAKTSDGKRTGQRDDHRRGKSGDAPGRTRKDADEPEVSPSGPVALPATPTAASDVELPSPPVLGESLGALAHQGDVQIKLPGEDDFQALGEAQIIPMGSTVDATEGLAEIVVTADTEGTRQNAVVTGSVFKVDQFAPAGEAPLTDLVLKGGDFSDCATDPAAVEASKRKRPTARAAKRKRTRGGVVRGLWAAAKGRFRTRGRHSAATVRGTRWAVVDRCASTTTKVLDGIVDVMDYELDTVFTLRAGERHVARRPDR